MAKFDASQTSAAFAIQQLVHDWAFDLDQHEGLHVHALVTHDCRYGLGPDIREGPADVEAFYLERVKRLSAQPTGLPTQRHVVANLRIAFDRAEAAEVTFSLVHFSTAGMASGLAHADPAAVADVRMSVRECPDGGWLCARLDSSQSFRRTSR